MVRTVRAGRRRRRSPELAGRPPAGGGTAANRGGREDSPPVSLAGLRFFPAKMVRTVRAGRRRRRSPELAGRPPAGGGTAANRGGREDSPPVSLAGLRFFPAKMVRTVRAGRRRRSSPELAGRPPAGGGSAPNRGGREDSPPMALVGLHFSPQIWSNPSEKGPRRKSSPDLAGPPPASGGRIFLRPMGVVADRNHRIWPSWPMNFPSRRIPTISQAQQHAHPYNRFAIFC